LHALTLCLSCCSVTPRATPFAQTHPSGTKVPSERASCPQEHPVYAGEMGKTLRGAVRPWRATEGAEPYTMKVVRAVLNGGCDMKSSQSLLCSTLCPDTTRCPISGILRRCAGRQRPVQRLRTMNPQSPDWHRTREGPMYLSASRRRRG